MKCSSGYTVTFDLPVCESLTCTCPLMGLLSQAFNANIFASTYPNSSWTGSQMVHIHDLLR